MGNWNKKRWTAWFMTLVLCLGLIPMNGIALADTLTPAQSRLQEQAAGLFEDQESVQVIVRLKEEGVVHRRLTSLSAKQSRMETARSKQKEVKAKIKAKGIDLEMGYSYSLLINGFSLTTSYGEAMEIAALPEVASVEVAAEFDAPAPPDEVKMKHSVDMVQAQSAWDLGYKGQGQLIAVLDSGADPEHKDFVLSDASKAKYPTLDSMQSVITQLGLSGKTFNSKVIYGYNYKDLNTGIKEIRQASGMHGMHVAGTTAANGDPAKGGVRGVAPEAQLLVMRVFGEAGGGTNEAIYLKAIEDAAALGADSINMSLGSPAGVIGRMGSAFLTAIQKAGEIGAVVNIAAGNEGFFGQSVALPKADAPDYGIVATPSIAPLALSVASINNRFIQMTALKLADGSSMAYRLSGTIPLVYGVSFDIVPVGLGKPADFEGKDLTGKVALIERGEINFTEKIANAHKAGAVAVIIFNNAAGGDTYVSMATDGSAIPAVSVTRSNGLKLQASPQPVTFSEEVVSETSVVGGEMSDFSNWGLSNEQEMKPEITAPGGDIYSTLNDDSYGGMSGTSMATPHVAGGTSLINERVKQDFPELTGTDRYVFIKNLLMSTATPHLHGDSQVPTSPRKQGAGVMNLDAAARSNVIVVDSATGLSKLNLKNVGSRFTVSARLINRGDQSVAFDYDATLQTDAVKNGRFELAPRLLEVVKGGSVTVAPHSEQTVTMELDASAYEQELSQSMPNGYYLEGFIRFTSADVPAVSLPYVGFKGTWNDIPVLEKSIYDYSGSEKPFYYTDTTTNFTHFFSSIAGKSVVLGYQSGQTPAYDKNRLVISPNGDGKLDDMKFRGTFLRNYRNVQLLVYEANGTTPIHTSFVSSLLGTKNHFSGDERWEKSTTNSSWSWNGRANYKTIPDGLYQLDVSVTPNIAGAKAQLTRFPVLVDTKMPALRKAAFDETVRKLTFEAYDVTSGILSLEVALADGTKLELIDGGYVIPAGINLADVMITVTDLGYNEFKTNAANALIPVNQGVITVRATTKDGSLTPSFKPVVRNEKGEIQASLTSLPYGTYTVEATEIQKGYITDQSKYTVTLTEAQPAAVVEFVFAKPNIPTGELVIALTIQDGPYPEVLQFVATDSKGVVYPLARDAYMSSWYVVDLPYESYTISLKNLLTGWTLTPETAAVEVRSSYPPITYMTLAQGVGGFIKPQAIGEDGLDVSDIEFTAIDEYGTAVDLTKALPNGSYTVYPTTVPAGVYVTPQSQEAELTAEVKEVKPAFTFRKTNGQTGSVKINTLKAKAEYPEIKPEYAVEDYYGNQMTDWEALPLGTYYVVVKNAPMEYSYEPYDAEIIITPEQPDHTVDFTFTKLSDTGKSGTLSLTVNDPTYSYRDNITFEITDEAGAVTTLVYDRLSFSSNRVKLPYGIYKVRALDVKDGWYLEPETALWRLDSLYSYLDFDLKQGTRPQVIQSVEELPRLTVPYGTAAGELKLPQTVNVTLNTGKTIELPVSWDVKPYDPEQTGLVKLSGELNLTGQTFTNPDQIKAVQEVEVEARELIISSVEAVEPLTAAYGTPKDALGLPATVGLKLSDGSTVENPVVWDLKPYTGKTGTVKLSGTLDLTGKEYLNPDQLKAVITIVVKPAEITETQTFERISVLEDTVWSELPLPQTVQVTLNDGSKAALPAEWIKSDYDASRIGEQTITGQIKLPEDGSILNPKELTLEVVIEIGNLERIAGSTRYDTAIAIGQRTVREADTIILVNGEASADSLLAGPLAVQLNAPILLLRDKSLSDKIAYELKRLGTSKVILVGGESVIPASVARILSAAGYSVERLGGSNRFQTSLLVDQKVRSLSGNQTHAVIANGSSLFDALTMGSAAGEMGVGILFNDGKTLSMIEPAMKGLTSATLVGGTLVEAKAVETNLTTRGIKVERLAGKTRYETAAAIANRFYSKADRVLIANGERPYDASAAAPLCHRYGAPLLLTPAKALNPATAKFITDQGIEKAFLLGGELAISPETETAIQDLLK